MLNRLTGLELLGWPTLHDTIIYKYYDTENVYFIVLEHTLIQKNVLKTLVKILHTSTF